MSKLCKEKVPTERLIRYQQIAREHHDACTDEDRKSAMAESHDIFVELIQWRMIHEKRQGDDGHVV